VPVKHYISLSLGLGWFVGGGGGARVVMGASHGERRRREGGDQRGGRRTKVANAADGRTNELQIESGDRLSGVTPEIGSFEEAETERVQRDSQIDQNQEKRRSGYKSGRELTAARVVNARSDNAAPGLQPRR
jgi:hypothetical protein